MKTLLILALSMTSVCFGSENLIKIKSKRWVCNDRIPLTVALNPDSSNSNIVLQINIDDKDATIEIPASNFEQNLICQDRLQEKRKILLSKIMDEKFSYFPRMIMATKNNERQFFQIRRSNGKLKNYWGQMLSKTIERILVTLDNECNIESISLDKQSLKVDDSESLNIWHSNYKTNYDLKCIIL